MAPTYSVFPPSYQPGSRSRQKSDPEGLFDEVTSVRPALPPKDHQYCPRRRLHSSPNTASTGSVIDVIIPSSLLADCFIMNSTSSSEDENQLHCRSSDFQYLPQTIYETPISTFGCRKPSEISTFINFGEDLGQIAEQPESRPSSILLPPYPELFRLPNWGSSRCEASTTRPAPLRSCSEDTVEASRTSESPILQPKRSFSAGQLEHFQEVLEIKKPFPKYSQPTPRPFLTRKSEEGRPITPVPSLSSSVTLTASPTSSIMSYCSASETITPPAVDSKTPPSSQMSNKKIKTRPAPLLTTQKSDQSGSASSIRKISNPLPNLAYPDVNTAGTSPLLSTPSEPRRPPPRPSLTPSPLPSPVVPAEPANWMNLDSDDEENVGPVTKIRQKMSKSHLKPPRPRTDSNTSKSSAPSCGSALDSTIRKFSTASHAHLPPITCCARGSNASTNPPATRNPSRSTARPSLSSPNPAVETQHPSLPPPPAILRKRYSVRSLRRSSAGVAPASQKINTKAPSSAVKVSHGGRFRAWVKKLSCRAESK